MKFHLSAYTKCKKEPLQILTGLEEPQQSMEDHMVMLQSIGGSRFATPFLSIVRDWERDLTITWIIVQQKWMYLEAIFTAGDISKQLPQEAARFEGIDRSFRKMMRAAQEVQYVMKCCLADKRLDDLRNLEQELEICQKALNDYLEAKRNAFPRFFFISSDEMLSILGGKELSLIQEHIIKVNIHTCLLIDSSFY
ncbi:unnamed protein product [Protopolystoma xenopodis]|uniref:Dynein heavy chain linker domain-containing protein n=1 Tax=Protopolystoma xenopodis TaxID=117903 RepID=A0A448WG30_9PLAT|nr:unnamed protein product [Protopolystoma xenopodis]